MGPGFGPEHWKHGEGAGGAGLGTASGHRSVWGVFSVRCPLTLRDDVRCSSTGMKKPEGDVLGGGLQKDLHVHSFLNVYENHRLVDSIMPISETRRLRVIGVSK